MMPCPHAGPFSTAHSAPFSFGHLAYWYSNYAQEVLEALEVRGGRDCFFLPGASGDESLDGILFWDDMVVSGR